MIADYNRAKNAAALGWAIALIAITLNLVTLVVIQGGTASPFGKAPYAVWGIALGVLTLVAAYFAESRAATSASWLESADEFLATHERKILRRFRYAAMSLCLSSYLCWLLSL